MRDSESRWTENAKWSRAVGMIQRRHDKPRNTRDDCTNGTAMLKATLQRLNNPSTPKKRQYYSDLTRGIIMFIATSWFKRSSSSTRAWWFIGVFHHVHFPTVNISLYPPLLSSDHLNSSSLSLVKTTIVQFEHRDSIFKDVLQFTMPTWVIEMRISSISLFPFFIVQAKIIILRITQLSYFV